MQALIFTVPTVARFVKYTGYGNAAGLLAARGLMAGGRAEGEYSEDEDTDTEEYKEAKAKYGPIYIYSLCRHGSCTRIQ